LVDTDVRAFTKYIKDQIFQVQQTDRIKYLDFLNEAQIKILDDMVRNDKTVNVYFNGGVIGANRKRGIITPTYIEEDAVDFKLSVYKIEVIGLGIITHSQVLGSLMSLNIDRSIIGDIIVTKDHAQFVAISNFDHFFNEFFNKVGRFDIRLYKITEQIIKNDNFEIVTVIVSSMRLDVIVKSLMNASRTKAEEFITAGNVRHNHAVEKKISKVCHLGDVLSIRKYGRFKLVDNEKTTKSGKYKLIINKSV